MEQVTATVPTPEEFEEMRAYAKAFRGTANLKRAIALVDSWIREADAWTNIDWINKDHPDGLDAAQKIFFEMLSYGGTPEVEP